MKGPTITTLRLVLREIEEQDAKIIVKWRSEPSVYRYFLYPHAITIEEHLNWYLNRYVHDTHRFDWIALDAKEVPVGIFGLMRSKCDPSEVEVNYILAPEAQGKGYAREAMEALMQYASTEWGCDHAIAEIHCENEASLHFAKNIGFAKDIRDGDFCVYKRKL